MPMQILQVLHLLTLISLIDSDLTSYTHVAYRIALLYYIERIDRN